MDENESGPHYYASCESKLSVDISLREVAELLQKKIDRYYEQGASDVARSVEMRGDGFAAGIEALLNTGLK